MRILLTADTVGGVWDHTVALTRELHARGHRVMLAVLGDRCPGREATLPPGVEIEDRPYRLEWMSDSAADALASSVWVSELASRWRAEIVQTHQYACAVADYSVPVVVVAHSDVVSWFAEVQGRAVPSEWSEYVARVEAGLRAADAVVAPTEYQSDLLRRHYGRAADLVIHNGIPPAAIPNEKPRESLIVCAGRAWDEAKGVRILDEALGLSGSRGLAVHLLGETRSPDGAVFRGRSRSLTPHGAKSRAEVDGWMRRASIYVAPSLYEPFGLAPLEAAVHGCALVLSDIGSFRELWDGCAEFFPTGNAAALGEILTRLSADTREVARLSALARARAVQRYTAERMCEAYLSLYSGCRSGSGVGLSIGPEHPPVIHPA